MQIPSGLGLFSPPVVGPLLWEIHPRHPPRAVSARATSSLFLCAACSLHSALSERSSGRLLFGGRKESFPQLGLLLVPSESTLRTTPFLVFISVGSGIASAFYLSTFDRGGARPIAMGAPSGNSPRLNANACPKSARRLADFPHPCAQPPLREAPHHKTRL